MSQISITKAPEMPRCDFRCWSSVEEPSNPQKNPKFLKNILTGTKGKLHGIDQRQTSQIALLVRLPP